jgi:hypothetical protein
MNVASNTTLDLRGQYLTFEPGERSIIDIAGSENVTILGGVFDGQGQEWNEGRHMIRVLGAVNVTITDAEFRNPIGDGIYLDQGAAYVTIRNNRFFGSSQNRNGISVVNAWNVWILNNHFVGMTRPGMPGAIDLEPDTADQACWDIHVERNIIEGGAGRGIQVYNEIAHATQLGSIVIKDNVITGSRDIAIACHGSPKVTEGSVVVEQNEITGAGTKLYVSQMHVTDDLRTW